MVIVINIWQKLSSVEHRVTLIVMNFWQLFPKIFGQTSLIVTNIWRNQIVQTPTALTGKDRFREGKSFCQTKSTITIQPLQATLPLFVRIATSNLEVKN
jgi:hypothetical protein